MPHSVENELRDRTGKWTKTVIPHTEVRVGDRLDISGKTRVSKVHQRGDTTLAQTKTTGARSPGIQHFTGDKVTVFREKAGGPPTAKPIYASDLSTADARRSPEVSESEFHQYAQRGEKKLTAFEKGLSGPVALEGARFKRVTDEAYDATREEWGGITVDSHTGEHVPVDADKYALTIRKDGVESVTVAPDASREDFDNAMSDARSKFAHELSFPGAHLGVFHDADLKRIDIDPVLVTPHLDDVHDIGAFTHATGGAYHFKSGDGFWPPHVKDSGSDPKAVSDLSNLRDEAERNGASTDTLASLDGLLRNGDPHPDDMQRWLDTYGEQLPSETYNGFQETISRLRKGRDMSLSITTPLLAGEFDLSARDGQLAFWKQILPKKTVHYTAKDGSRQTLDFTEDYLRDLASNTAVDSVGFLLADRDNAHTMDPERWRGKVAAMEVRDDGLYGKIVFSSTEAARAVLDNPELGVSARIRENVGRSDGSTVPRGIIHVLGTLDPQVSGMSPWQPTDLSTDQGDTLDLSDEEYEDMSDKATKTETPDLSKMSEAELSAYLDTLDDDALDAFLTDLGIDPEAVSSEEEVTADEKTLVTAGAGADMSNVDERDIELANARAEGREALKRVAAAEWREERNAYMSDGVPPAALDLAAPVLNRASDMVIDLSNEGGDDVNASAVVRGLLDALKGTVDLSTESGHFGTHSGEDNPDEPILARWNIDG